MLAQVILCDEDVLALSASYLALMGFELIGSHNKARVTGWTFGDQVHGGNAYFLVPVSRVQLSIKTGASIVNHSA